ncbi:MAG: hypothetical protein Hens3KO_22660 [Henriciella sp.]
MRRHLVHLLAMLAMLASAFTAILAEAQPRLESRGVSSKTLLMENDWPEFDATCRQSDSAEYCDCVGRDAYFRTLSEYRGSEFPEGMRDPDWQVRQAAKRAHYAAEYAGMQAMFASKTIEYEAGCREEEERKATFEAERIEKERALVALGPNPSVWDGTYPPGLENNNPYKICASRSVAFSHYDCACIANSVDEARANLGRHQVEGMIRREESGILLIEQDADPRMRGNPELKAATLDERQGRLEEYRQALATNDTGKILELTEIDDNTAVNHAISHGTCQSPERMKSYARFECVRPGGAFNRIGGGSDAYCSCISQNYSDFTSGLKDVRAAGMVDASSAAARACSANSTR